MDDVLKQFIIDLYAIGQEMQKKPPENSNEPKVSNEKGSGPVSPNYQAR